MVAKNLTFDLGDKVVYPSHGVGSIQSLELQEIAGEKINLYVIYFERERMTLRLPVAKADISGLRCLSSRGQLDNVMKILKTKGKIKRTMWARRAQEYEAKINSGNPESIAQVLRDLHRTKEEPDQSYSERQLYQNALMRLCQELSIVKVIEESEARKTIQVALNH